MNKGLTLNLLKYELRNAFGNLWSITFALILPVILGIVIFKGATNEVPKEIWGNFATTIYIAMGMMTVYSILLLGYGANYSMELSQNVTLRLNLFGISPKTLVLGKLIAQMIIFTVCYSIYTLILYNVIPIKTPDPLGLTYYIISILALCILLFILAHGISNITRKFGPTYAATMSVMFIAMFSSGSMGIKVESFPKVVQDIVYMLPFTYISQDFYKVWIGESYNFIPFIQSMLFLGAFSIVVLLFSFHYRKRK